MPILYVTTSPHFEYDDSTYMVIACSTIEYAGFDATQAMEARNQAVAGLRSRWRMEDFDTSSLPNDIETITDLASYAYRVWKFETHTADLSDLRLIMTPMPSGAPGWELSAVAEVDNLTDVMSSVAQSKVPEGFSFSDFAYSASVRMPRRSVVSW